MHVDKDDLLDLVNRLAEEMTGTDAHRRAVLAKRLRTVAANNRYGGRPLRGLEIIEFLNAAIDEPLD